MKKGFRGAAIVGHRSGTDQTTTAGSSRHLKFWSSKPTTVNFVFFSVLSKNQGANEPKLAKMQPNTKFQVA